MHMPTIHERNQEITDDSESQRHTPSPSRAASPTPSLEPCDHCGEDYCADARIETARRGCRCKPSIITISHSTPSTPAKPLRKKRRLDSLASMAKEQAGRSMHYIYCGKNLPDAEIVPGVPRMSPSTGGSMVATADAPIISAAKEDGTKVSKPEQLMKLQLQIPGNEYITRESTPPNRVDTRLSGHVASPSTPDLDTRSPERRKLDELHEGVKIIYKQPSPRKSAKRLSSLLRLS